MISLQRAALVVAAGLLVMGTAAGVTMAQDAASGVIGFVEVKISEPVVFDKHVFPILLDKCLTCHDEEGGLAEGDLDLTRVDTIKKGGKRGPAIVAGKGALSLLIKLASRLEKPAMPPKKEPPLTSQELSVLKLWIDQGAKAGSNPKPADGRNRPVTLGTLPPGVHPVIAIDIDKAGRTVAAGRASQVFVYDVASGGLRAQLAGHQDVVQSVAFSPDGKWLSAGGYRIVKLWHVPQDTERGTLAGHAATIKGLVMSPDGKLAASASEDKTVRIWDWTVGKQLRQIDEPASALGVAFRPDGAQIAVACGDNRVRIHNLADGKLAATLEGYTNQVACVSFSHDGRWLASGTLDALVRVWDLPRTPKNPQPTPKDLKGHSKAVRQVSIVGESVVSASEDGTIRVWNLVGGKEMRSINHGAAILTLAISPDQQLVASGGADNQTKIWKLADGANLRAISAHSKPVQAIAFSRDGKELASGGDDNNVFVWDIATGRVAHSFVGHTGPVAAAAFAPGALLTGSADKTIKVWNNQGTWGEPIEIGPFADRVTAMDFSPDSKLLATGGGSPAASGELIIWDIATRKPSLAIKEPHSDTVFGVAFSPDGKLIASAAADKFLKVHDVATGKLVKSFEGHTAHLLAADWKSDGKQLASASADNSIKVWNYDTGEQMLTVGGHSNQVTGVRWVGTSDRLVSSCADRTVRRINASNGGIERGYGGAADFLYCVATSENGVALASGGQDGKIFIWDGNNGNLVRTLDSPPTQTAK